MNTNPASSHLPANDHVHGDVPLETAFEFLNTVDLKGGALVEHLTSLDAAAAWLADNGVIRDRGVLEASGRTVDDRGRVLGRLIATRTALREVSHAVAHERAPDPAAIDEVNRALRSRERIELVARPDGACIGHSHVGDPVDDILARLAEPIVREIGAGHDDRIRVCANDTCRWLFYDESRSGRRRWCDMATCGNRAKARRHRARVKDSAPDAATATATAS